MYSHENNNHFYEKFEKIYLEIYQNLFRSVMPKTLKAQIEKFNQTAVLSNILLKKIHLL